MFVLYIIDKNIGRYMLDMWLYILYSPFYYGHHKKIRLDKQHTMYVWHSDSFRTCIPKEIYSLRLIYIWVFLALAFGKKDPIIFMSSFFSYWASDLFVLVYASVSQLQLDKKF